MLRLLNLCSKRPGVSVKGTACFRYHHAGGCAEQQSLTEMRLQCCNLLAQRRLADAEFDCGTEQ